MTMIKETPKNLIEEFVSPIGELLDKRFQEATEELKKLYEKSKSHDRTNRTLAE